MNYFKIITLNDLYGLIHLHHFSYLFCEAKETIWEINFETIQPKIIIVGPSGCLVKIS